MGFDTSYILNSKIPVELTGNNVDDGTKGAVSLIKDENGDSVLRIVDAAPFAYDAASDKLKTVSSKKAKITKSRNIHTTAVNVAGVHTTTITPSAGYLGRLKQLAIYVPGIATSTGNHKIYVTVGAESGYKAERTFNIDVPATTIIEVLASDPALKNIFEGIVFDSVNPLTITYTNSSNINQTGTRLVAAIFEEEAVG